MTLNFSLAQVFQWATKSDFLHATAGLSIASDFQRNVYTAGVYTTSDTTDPSGIYVAKYDSSGKLLWYQQGKAPHNYCVKNINIAVDGAGNAIISGTTQNLCGFDIQGINFSAPTGMFLVKLNGQGIVQWGLAETRVFGMAVCCDIQGNIYVAGRYMDSVYVGNQLLPYTSGRFFGYVVKYSPTGQFKWVKAMRSLSDIASQSIVVKANTLGNVYIAGTYLNTSYLDSYTLTPIGDYDIFLAKLDSNGNYSWVQKAGGYPLPYSCPTCPCASGEDDVYAIDVDMNNNVYITGGFQGKAKFGTYTVTSAGINTNTAGRDIFVAKYDSGGSCLWANRIGGTADEWATAITVDTLGNSYVNGNGFLTKFDAAGNYAWTHNANAANTGMALERSGNALYIGGAFYNSVTFGTITLASNNVQYGYVAKMTDTSASISTIAAPELPVRFTIYPNPTTGNLVVAFSGDPDARVTLRVRNALGMVICTSGPVRAAARCETLDLGLKPKGIYFVELSTEGGTVSRKVILH
jgi:hypothetical protein